MTPSAVLRHSSTVLHSASAQVQQEHGEFQLGPLDGLVQPHIPIAVVFVYTAIPGRERPVPLVQLREAISETLKVYPHLTGRLQSNRSGSRPPRIDRANAGALLVQASSSKRLSDAADLTLEGLPGGGIAFLPPYDPSAFETEPLLAIQHTRFACDGVSIGIRLPHVVCDATGFFHFVSDLSKIYRRLSSRSAEESSLSPLALQPFAGPNPGTSQLLSEDYQPDIYRLAPPMAPQNSTVAMDLPRGLLPAEGTGIEGRCLRFTAAQLAAIKVQASEREHPRDDSWISTFDALAAHLYCRTHRARLYAASGVALSPTDFLCPVDIRKHICPSQRYFPNVLLTACTEVSPDALTSGQLSAVAQRIHRATTSRAVRDKSEVTRTVAWLASQPDIRRIQSTFRYGTGSLMLSQWNKIDVFGAAALDGLPDLVAPPFTTVSLVDGLGYLLPGPSEPGAIDVYLALDCKTWAFWD